MVRWPDKVIEEAPCETCDSGQESRVSRLQSAEIGPALAAEPDHRKGREDP